MLSSFQIHRLSKHADYGLVYGASRKHASSTISFFYRQRAQACSPEAAARFGITVPRAIGGAVVRNRIKRRVRVVARESIALLPPDTDVVLHPRPGVATMPHPDLQREIAEIFGRIARRIASGAENTPLPRGPRRSNGKGRAR